MSVLFAPRWLVFVVIGVLFVIKAVGTLDPDFGWHLRSGWYILENGIPAHDIFTYTATDFPWIHHEWLADVISAVIYNVGGYWTLGIFFALLWVVAIWLVSRHNPATFITLMAAVVILPFSGIRATTWTVFFLAILYTLLRHGGPRRVMVYPLMLLWANMHGGFALGLVYLAWQVLSQRSRTLLLLLVGSVLLTWITPYGPEMYVEIWRTMADRELHGNINEWRSFAVTVVATGIIGVWAAARILTVRPLWRAVLSFESLLLAAALSSIRNLPLFALMALAWLSSTLRLTRDSADRFWRATYPIRRHLSAAAVALLAVVGFGVYEAIKLARVEAESRMPQQIARALENHPCDGRLFNSYNIGGYLIWRSPSNKVYIDGRMPSWEYEDNKYMRTYSQVFSDKSVRSSEFKKYGITCVAIEKNNDLVSSLEKEGWKKELTDAGYVLLRKQ